LDVGGRAGLHLAHLHPQGEPVADLGFAELPEPVLEGGLIRTGVDSAEVSAFMSFRDLGEPVPCRPITGFSTFAFSKAALL
jgi:hypothetical protein